MYFKKTSIGFLCLVILCCLPAVSTEIHEASHSGDLEKVKELLQEQPSLLEAKADDGGAPLHFAAHGSQIEVMDYLLSAGATLEAKDNQGSTPLVWAAANGKKDSVIYLLDKGAGIHWKDGQGNSLLHIAAIRGLQGVAEVLLSRGLNVNAVNSNKTSPLIFSITQGKSEILPFLLDHGADLEHRDANGFTALRIAVLFGDVAVVDKLLSHGADPSEKYDDGFSPLHIACTEGHSDVAARLIKKGADASLRDGEGFFPLHLAAFHGQSTIVETLLSNGSDVNSLSDTGDTPLHGAAWGGFIETAELLITHGADAKKKNSDGFTPIDYAEKGGREEMIRLLKSIGASPGENRDPFRIDNGGIPTMTQPETKPITMTVLYDNYIAVEGTRSAWGFSCLIEGTEQTILFDTGGEAEVLLHNIDKLDVDLDDVDMVVISHNHWDHTGGLSAVLERHPGLPVYLPYSFPYEFIRKVESQKGHVIPVDKPVQICRNVYLTGQMGEEIKEMSLICSSGQGPVLVTGCSHPGISDIVQKATDIVGKSLHFVFGGFHLGGTPEAELNSIIERFQKLGVEKCGATHCTGEEAINMFKNAYGKNYLPIGTGRVFVFKEQ